MSSVCYYRQIELQSIMCISMDVMTKGGAFTINIGNNSIRDCYCEFGNEEKWVGIIFLEDKIYLGHREKEMSNTENYVVAVKTPSIELVGKQTIKPGRLVHTFVSSD
jgi:hypothetical protein